MNALVHCPSRTQGHSGPSLFISVPRPPRMNASFYRPEDGQAGACAGQAEDWIGGCPWPPPGSPKGSVLLDFGSLHPLPETQPRSADSHDQPPALLPPRAPHTDTQPTARGQGAPASHWPLASFLPRDWPGPSRSSPLRRLAVVQPAAA